MVLTNKQNNCVDFYINTFIHHNKNISSENKFKECVEKDSKKKKIITILFTFELNCLYFHTYDLQQS